MGAPSIDLSVIEQRIRIFGYPGLGGYTHELARSRRGLPPAEGEESRPHALRHVPAAHRPTRATAEADLRYRDRGVAARTGKACQLVTDRTARQECRACRRKPVIHPANAGLDPRLQYTPTNLRRSATQGAHGVGTRCLCSGPDGPRYQRGSGANSGSF